MSSKTALATAASLSQLPVTAPTASLGDYGGEVDFLSRIQLVTKGKYVDNGAIPPGHYGVPQGDDEIEDLGESIDVIVFDVRDKALDTNEDPPVAVYTKADEKFAEIVSRASEKDSGCMFGPSLLVFERNTGRFYELFLGNKSGRQEAQKIQPFLQVTEEQAAASGQPAHGPLPCTFKAKYIKRPRYSWHAPQVTKCSTPFTNLPPVEKILEEINKFRNQKSDAPTKVAEGARSR